MVLVETVRVSGLGRALSQALAGWRRPKRGARAGEGDLNRRVGHLDFLRRTLLVHDVIVEVTRRDSPTSERFVTKPYPKNDQPRRLGITVELVQAIARHIEDLDLGGR
jgi:hypothetical protein